MNPHGAMIVDSNLTVYQAIGLPAPQGFLVVIPKYQPASGDTGGPWRLGPLRLARILREYGPRGVEDASRRRGGRRFDAVYGAPMPYLGVWEAVAAACPRRALDEAVARGEEGVVSVLSAIEAEGVEAGALGLTGSRALWFHDPLVSDVDLVVYDHAVESVMAAFERHEPAAPPRGDLGGVRVDPPTPLGWRRARIAGYVASWVGVSSSGPAAHCPPLRGYPVPDPPMPGRLVEAVLHVEPGQLGALLYPPCVNTGRLWIVSFEFNLAKLFYEGGLIRVRAVSSPSGGTLYLGLREEPGLVRVMRRPV